MPGHRGHTRRAGALRSGPAILLTLALAGCMGSDGPGVAKSSMTPGGEIRRAGDDTQNRSAIIGELLSRKSILPGSGAYAEVAQAVIEANAAPARAELRVARLKAEARATNWLPSIRPSLSLTDLGETFASLLLEQVLFDGGGRKAERAFAAADVEVAATTLAQDFNQRVFEGLGHYIRAQRALEQANLANQAVGRMAEFERIVGIRLEGGMSDRSEQRIIQQKTSEMRAKANDDRFQAQQSIASLEAMAARPLSGLSGLQALPADAGAPEPLAVLKARAEGSRSLAEADMAKSGYRPGLKAVANLDQDGDVESGLSVDFDNAIGLGTGAELEALAMTGELTDRRIARASDEANRNLIALQHQITTLQARRAEGETVLAQTGATLDMFTEQYKVGRRSLLELVNMFESWSGMQREQASLKYEIALLQLQIARDRGVLVDGAAL
ncbi:MAG: TolC family protein [Gemmobacter sp.]|uniref:TolC family protein n=1 Tax=Gemmobacter sp. TaxID=1898957 RepID=UPI001A4F2EB9|nr:TolC family protein [Gemmobacter sp.]MBL8562045.1 TolC family protein [Gemmobacter sp.]